MEQYKMYLFIFYILLKAENPVMKNTSLLSYKSLFLIALLNIPIFAQSKKLVCQVSPNQNKKICYYKQEHQPPEFLLCEETLCLKTQSQHCQNTTLYYDEELCIKKLCNFKENDGGDIAACGQKISQNYKQIISIKNSQIFIIVILTFLVVICSLLIQKLKASRRNMMRVSQREQNQNEEQNAFQIGPNFHLTDGHQQKQKNQPSFFKTSNQREIQTYLNLGYVALNQQTQMCSICLISDKVNCQTACGHFYHSQCLIQWIRKKPSCPSCRSQNFVPIIIFCFTCKKIRDIFRINKGTYLSCTGLTKGDFNVLKNCNSCVQSISSKRFKQVEIS